MIRQDKAALPVGLSEIQAYVRVETGEEEALLAGLLRVATEMCESFCNQALMTRSFEEDVAVRDGWTLLTTQPVRSIISVIPVGASQTLSTNSYKVDIDHDGRAFVKDLPAGATFRVTGEAGLANEPNQVPEPLRQGILRLAASLFANRDSSMGELPSAVTALWRPYRRVGLCR